MHREGYLVEFGGQFEAQQSASRTLLFAGAGITVVMLMLLQLSTGRARTAVLVMLNLPLSLIGGIAAIYLTESPGVVGNTLAPQALAMVPLGSGSTGSTSAVSFAYLAARAADSLKLMASTRSFSEP